MKITDRTVEEIQLNALKAGDCFKCNNDVFIVTDCSDKHEADCVNLNNGEIIPFDKENYVTSIKCELIVKGADPVEMACVRYNISAT